MIFITEGDSSCYSQACLKGSFHVCFLTAMFSASYSTTIREELRSSGSLFEFKEEQKYEFTFPNHPSNVTVLIFNITRMSNVRRNLKFYGKYRQKKRERLLKTNTRLLFQEKFILLAGNDAPFSIRTGTAASYRVVNTAIAYVTEESIAAPRWRSRSRR